MTNVCVFDREGGKESCRRRRGRSYILLIFCWKKSIIFCMGRKVEQIGKERIKAGKKVAAGMRFIYVREVVLVS